MKRVDTKPTTGHRDFEFIVALRAIAALLVVYDHLVGTWLRIHPSITWAPFDFITTYIVRPLAIAEDFGALGVIIFFLSSGFIITYTAQRESHITFAIKRLLRIYPPLALSIIVAALLVITSLLDSPTGRALTLPEVLWSMTLANYLFRAPYVISAVNWTLVIEVLFYTLCVVVLYPIKMRARMAVLVNLGICSVILLTAQDLGPNFTRLAPYINSVPYLICGQVVYYLWSKRIGWRSFAVLIIACYFVNILGVQFLNPNYDLATDPYFVASIYGFGIFIIFLIFNDQLKTPPILRFFGTISFSLYLYHGTIGWVLVTRLTPALGYTPALVMALAGSTATAYLSWRFVEKPSQQLARSIIKQLRLDKSTMIGQWQPAEIPPDPARA